MATKQDNTLLETVSNVTRDVASKATRSLPKKVDNNIANQPKKQESNLSEALIQTGEKIGSTTVSRPLAAKEFFWDDLLSYLASAIVALALVDISVEFLAGDNLGLLCLTPLSSNNATVDFDRDQSAFVNSFCSRYISLAEFYPLFTLVQGVVLFSPHHIWLSIYSKYFNFFFALVSMLERLRERSTGSYSTKNASIIQRLEQEFANQDVILKWYWTKLAIQGVLYFFFIVLTFGLFTDFSQDITCPPLSEESLPAFGRVMCVYARFRLLNVLRIANGIILVLGLAVVLIGAYNLSTSEFLNSKALNYKQVAVFSYHSALHPSLFYATHKGTRFKIPHFSLGSSDMDFMHFKLFSTDAGYANILRENQVSDEVSKLIEADYQLQYIYETKILNQAAAGQSPNNLEDGESVVTNETTSSTSTAAKSSTLQINLPDDGRPQSKMNTLQEFVQCICTESVRGVHDSEMEKTAALDICFHRHSYMFSMAKKFQRVASLHFDEHYHGKAMNEVYSIGDIHSIRVPTNILALPYEQIEKLTKMIRRFLEWKSKQTKRAFQFHLIVVSGVDDDIKAAAVSHMIEILSLSHTKHIAPKALLLVLGTPTKINGMKTKNKKAELDIDDLYWKPQPFNSKTFSVQQVRDTKSVVLTVYVSCGEDNGNQEYSQVECSFQCSLFKYNVVTHL